MISILDGWLGGSPWAPLLVDISLKGAALLLVALLLTVGLRRASASMRHRVWSLAFVSLLALPLLVGTLPAWRVPVLPTAATVDGSGARIASHGVTGGEPEGPAMRPLTDRSVGPASEASPAVLPPGGGTAGEGTAAAGSARAVGRALLGVWAVGVLLLLGRLGVGVLAAAWTTRRATPLDDAEWRRAIQRVSLRLRIRREVRLLVSDRVSVPVTWGIWRPAVVLPRDAETWSEERRRVVLLHELAHVRRRDCLVHVLSQAARALHWLNPLAWTGARRLQAEREKACDDLVLASGMRGPEYAHHLLEIARASGRGRPSRAAWAGVAMARPTELEGRLLAILDSERERRRPGRLASAGTLVTVGAVLLPIAAFQPSPRPAMPAPTVPAAEEVHEAQEVEGPAPATGPIEDLLVEVEVEEPVSLLAAGLLGLATKAGLDRALGQAADTTDARILQAFLTALQDEDPSIRRQAAHALGRMESTAAVEGLSRAVGADSDPGVRSQAAWALGTIESADGVPALVDALGDADTEVRSQAAWALGMIESADAVPGLVGAVGDESASVRGQIAWALGMIESSDAAPGLERLVRDSEPSVRERAAWALGMIESAAGIPALATALEDEHVESRAQAAWALGMIGSAEAVPVLVRALHDPSATVRKQAVWALGMIEDPSAADALVDAIEDEDIEVRKQALWALSRVLGG